MRFIPLAVLATLAGVAVVAAAPANKFPPGPYKNLKLMPRNTTAEKLETVMKSFETSLGVDCSFCHVENDFAKDDNKHKRVSREMIKATMAFNQKVFKGKPEVTCMTCHRGKEEPELP